MSARGRNWLLRPLAMALLALAVLALLLGWFALQRALLQTRLEHWQAQWLEQRLPSTQELAQAQGSIAAQLRFLPTNADVLLLAGKLNEWSAQAAIEPGAHDALLASALQHYQHALQERPLWPETYVVLVILKWRRGQFDAQLRQWVDNAQRVGPNEPKIHLALTDVGLAGLRVKNFADAAWLAMVQRQLQLAARHPHAREALAEILQRHQLQGWGCKQLPEDTAESVRKKICI